MGGKKYVINFRPLSRTPRFSSPPRDFRSFYPDEAVAGEAAAGKDCAVKEREKEWTKASKHPKGRTTTLPVSFPGKKPHKRGLPRRRSSRRSSRRRLRCRRCATGGDQGPTEDVKATPQRLNVAFLFTLYENL
jgi:hypothetical protein